ncbi:hypothetical protein [Priestia megaterium]|uniref:hypothetical protein n=1 Tax=Priestia megaterium TaxID=1404 RepID=UPI00366E47A1
MGTWNPEEFKRTIRQVIDKMLDFNDEFIYDENGELVDVIVQVAFSWDEEKGEEHLRKRIEMGHLEKGTSMDKYNEIIEQLLAQEMALVSIHPNSFNKFVVGSRKFVDGKDWIVMFDNEGVIKTAYPPGDFDSYFTDSYHFLCYVDDLPSS